MSSLDPELWPENTDWDDDELTADDIDGGVGGRRWPIVAIALLVAVGLALLPIGTLFGDNPPVAPNGLEICGYDYCVVRDAVEAAGLGLDMSRLANQILDDEQAVRLVDRLTSYLGIEAIEVAVVDDLQGRIGGYYSPAERLIVLDRPANSWVVAHEVAHAVAPGHGAEFRELLIEIVRELSGGD